MARLSRADLEAALTFAAELGAAAPERARADAWMLERLAALIGFDFAGYYHLDAAHHAITEAEYGGPQSELPEAEFPVSPSDLPFCVYARRIGNPYFQARRLSDILDLGAFRETELFEVLGADPSIQMRMPASPGTHWTLDLERMGRDFSDRDLLLLDAVRPAIVSYEAYRAVAARVEAQGRPPEADGGLRLSQRENQVLDLVAGGASNSEIGVRLSISAGTVKKHLENIFGKLEVASRTGALAHTGRTVAPPRGDANRAI
jgi:DNA-binding CsgD family transcriptional regulator